MSKHTKGPWQYDGESFIFASPMREGRMIAEIRGWGWLQKKGEKEGMAEQDANGFLISTAPDLLEACKESLNALLDYVETLEKQGGSMNYGKKVIAQLVIVIAKAEGVAAETANKGEKK